MLMFYFFFGVVICTAAMEALVLVRLFQQKHIKSVFERGSEPIAGCPTLGIGNGGTLPTAALVSIIVFTHKKAVTCLKRTDLPVTTARCVPH